MKELKNLTKIKNLLLPYTKRVYFVGGSVRDEFFNLFFNTNLQNKDFDIEIYDISPEIFHKIMQEIKANGVGKNFFVYKYENYDLSLPRTENKISYGHKGFDVSLCNDEKIAVKRRDFTINSIMKNIFTGEILDFHNGINDIKNKKLKLIDKKSFVEDSLRVLRGVGFASRFNLKIENATFEIMKNLNISDLSKDRILTEMIKIFKSDFSEIGLKLLFNLNKFEQIFGFKISQKDLEKSVNFFKKAKKFVKDERFFLYILCNLNGQNLKEVLQFLKLNKTYKSLINEPFYMKISPEILMKISIQTPLKNWLGLYNQKRVNLAKKLKIYDKKFDPKIDIKEILDQGYKAKEISKQIEKQQKIAIKNYLKYSYRQNF